MLVLVMVAVFVDVVDMALGFGGKSGRRRRSRMAWGRLDICFVR